MIHPPVPSPDTDGLDETKAVWTAFASPERPTRQVSQPASAGAQASPDAAVAGEEHQGRIRTSVITTSLVCLHTYLPRYLPYLPT